MGIWVNFGAAQICKLLQCLSQATQPLFRCLFYFVIYLYMETFSMRSAVSVSVMTMPFGETVSVTFRNFLALALACGDGI